MHIFIEKDYDLMSAKASEDIMKLLETLQNPLICPATGDSPKGLYHEMIKRLIKKNRNINDWNFIGLDEWVGMNGKDQGSCRFHLDNDLLNPLKVPESRISFFDGRASNIKDEISKANDFIKKNRAIDLVILGLGLNGHIGMNEPGTDPSLHTHITAIDPVTQQSGQKYFTHPQPLNQGITLGIADIMEPRHVILLISGGKKAEIARAILEDEISDQLPASFLRNHENYTVYLDKDAASLLRKKND